MFVLCSNHLTSNLILERDFSLILKINLMIIIRKMLISMVKEVKEKSFLLKCIKMHSLTIFNKTKSFNFLTSTCRRTLIIMNSITSWTQFDKGFSFRKISLRKWGRGEMFLKKVDIENHTLCMVSPPLPPCFTDHTDCLFRSYSIWMEQMPSDTLVK